MKRFLSQSLLAGLISIFAVAPALALNIGFAPVNQTVPLGTNNFAVNILATLGTGEIVSAYDLDVTYDATILTVNHFDFGTFLGGPSDSYQIDDLSTSGLIDFAEVSYLSDADLSALQSGSITLGTIYFDAIGLGTSALNFANFGPQNDIKGAGNVQYTTLTIGTGSVTVGNAPVPEPGTMLLLATGLGGFWVLRRKLIG